MASIKLKNITKEYQGGVKAVNDISLDVAAREFVVLVGPSGCGKSTTLRMIAGLESISCGELYIGDHLVNHIEPKNRDIAMVFQNYALYPHMSVFENMSFSLRLRKTPKDEIKQKVEEAAKILNISHLLDRKPKALSGGERQRVALGRAIVRNPAVFLFDEPLSNLDAKLRTSMRSEIIKLHKRLGATFIYVTHDQIEAMTMGDRIVVMKNGEIQQADIPENLYDYPCNLFVASFIGSPSINLLPAIIQKFKGGYAAVCGEHFFPLLAENFPLESIASYEGREIVLGIRPEHLYLQGRPDPRAESESINVQIEILEFLGAETIVHLIGEQIRLVAKIPVRIDASPGDFMQLKIDCTKLHLFDKDTEQRIVL